MSTSVTCLIVATHELFAVGLRSTLRESLGHRLGPKGRIDIVMNDSRHEPFREVCSSQNVAVVIYETDLYDTADRISIEHLRAALPDAKILVAAAFPSYDQVAGFYSCHVDGLILKNRPAQTFVEAVETALEGGVVMPEANRAADDFEGLPARVSPQDGQDILPEDLRRRLSARQRTVLLCLAQGMSNKQIARALKLSEATIKVHVNAVFRVLNVHNRASAVARVFKRESEDERGDAVMARMESPRPDLRRI